MIANWNTIEKIATKIQMARKLAKRESHRPLVKAKFQKIAREWERLLRKFADSCQMVEEFTLQVFHGIQFSTHRISAVSVEAAKNILALRRGIPTSSVSCR